LFLLCKGLVDNTYPKECTNNEKGSVVHRAKGHFLCYRKVGLNILISIEHLLTISSSLKDWFYFVLSLICIYAIYRNIQTYREKVIMSGGIANRHARATGAWEDEEHY
jgi:hypothetical protein